MIQVNRLLRRILPRTPQERGVFWSIVGGCGNSIFVNLAIACSSVGILFMGDLGMSKTQIGAINSLLPFFGLLALVVAPAVTRWGLKRTYLFFFTIRKAVTLLMVFTPWVLAQGGTRAAFLYIVGIVAVFAACRAIGETAVYPWSQEFVPNAIRGQYAAVSQVTSTIATLLAVGFASLVMARVAGWDKYVILIIVGVIFGFLSVWWAAFIPKETAVESAGSSGAHFRVMGEALRNPDYARYLAGFGLTILASAVTSFMPLFMKEQVGLSPQAVVGLQTGALLGSVFFSYLWGWMADRYGGKRPMLIGLAVRLCAPLCWLLMPRQSAASLAVAQAIAFLDGAGSVGFGIGAGRLLFVRIVPPAQRTSYLALYYAWMGLLGGIAPLVAGRVLDVRAGWSGHWGFIALDAYTSLFVAGAALYALSLALFARAPADAGAPRR